MPKKFVGENSKAVAAKAKKAAAKDVEDAKKKKDLEDSLWKDENKQVLKRQQKKVFGIAIFILALLTFIFLTLLIVISTMFDILRMMDMVE